MTTTNAIDPAPHSALVGTGFEKIGVDRIPEPDRTSTPWTFCGIQFGTCLSLALLIYGALGIEFGLGFWSAVTSYTVGTVLGVLIIVPLIVIGARTATNNSTASGGHFGVRGRLIGSLIGLAINCVYTALGIWSGGQIIVAILSRLVGLPNNDLTLALAYGALSVVIAAVAIYGFQALMRFEIAIAFLGAVSFVLILAAFIPHANWSYHSGSYLLGSYWKTWIFSAVAVGASGPMASAIFMGDWSRYISPAKNSMRRLALLGSGSLILGLLVPSILGAIIAVALKNPLANFYPAFVAAAPTWTIIALLPLAVLGAVAFVATNMYSSGLDLDAIVPRLSRAWATVLAVIASTALVFLGSLVWNAQNSVIAASLWLIAITAPWAAVTGIGYLSFRGRYRLDDLQVFNRRERGGRYWYRKGFNRGAVLAWFVGALWGALAIDASPIYKGPLAGIAGGVDTSFLGSFLLAAIIYLAYLKVSSARRDQPALAANQSPSAPSAIEELKLGSV